MRRFAIWLTLWGIVCTGGLVLAQPGPAQVAFVSPAGQLVIASANGTARWIVTNPGEQLHPAFVPAWSPDGTTLFYALVTGNEAELRLANPATQGIQTIGYTASVASGGDWTVSGQLLIAGSARELASIILHLPQARLAQPGAGDRDRARNASPHEDVILYLSEGQYQLLAGGSARTLPLRNEDAQARNSGLWHPTASLVALWGSSPSQVNALLVADTRQDVVLNLDGRSTPLIPLGWLPGPALLFRNPASDIALADLSCWPACPADRLAQATVILPASASDAHPYQNGLLFRQNDSLYYADLACAARGDCAQTATLLAANLAPRTRLARAGDELFFTTFATDAFNPQDREARLLTLTCLPACQSRLLMAGAVAGGLSPDGAYALVDQAGVGVQLVSLADRATLFLSASGDPLGSTLPRIIWNG